ncbi:thermonuclease family protein [Pseudomonas aeruginosa]
MIRKSVVGSVCALILMGAGVCNAGESELLGKPRVFDKPIEFAGQVLTKAGTLEYWVFPFPEDVKGYAKVREYVQTSRTNNFRDNPLAIPIRLAGIKIPDLDRNRSNDLVQDNFPENSLAKADEMVIGLNFQFTCYGSYTDHVVPFCDLVGQDGVSVVLSLVENGLAATDPADGFGGPEHQSKLDAAVEKAKQSQAGIWKPLHVMMRGLQ